MMLESWNMARLKVQRMVTTVVLVLWRYLEYLQTKGAFTFGAESFDKVYNKCFIYLCYLFFI